MTDIFLHKHSKHEFLKSFLCMYLLLPFHINYQVAAQKAVYYTIFTLCVALLLLRLIFGKYKKKIFMPLLLYVYVTVILLVWAMVLPALYGTYDYSYVHDTVNQLIRIIFFIGLTILCKDVADWCEMYIKASSLYVLSSCMLMIPPLRKAYSQIVYSTSSVSAEKMESGARYYTRFGLTGFSGFGHAYTCTIAVVFCCYVLTLDLDKERRKRCMTYLVINLLGAAFYGRVGFLVSSLCIGLTAVYMAVMQNKVRLLLRITAISAALIAVFVANFQYILQINSLRWMFEAFINLFSGEGFQTSSSNTLMNSYFIPEGKTLWWGDGRYTIFGPGGTSYYYMRVDVGWLRALLYWGIFATILYYAATLILLNTVRKNLKWPNVNFLVALLLLISFLYELKGGVNYRTQTVLVGLNVRLLLDQQFPALRSQIHVGINRTGEPGTTEPAR